MDGVENKDGRCNPMSSSAVCDPCGLLLACSGALLLHLVQCQGCTTAPNEHEPPGNLEGREGMGRSSEGGDDIRVYFEVNRLLNEYAEFWEEHWEKFVELPPHLRINIMAISDDEPFIDLEQVKDETTD